jgi:signal transduction histidine kinase
VIDMTFGAADGAGRYTAGVATSNRLLLAAGLATWAMAGASTFAALLRGDAAWSARVALWLAAYVVFGAAFTAHVATTPSPRGRIASLALQSAAAVAILLLRRGDPTGLSGVLLALVAGQLPFAVSLRVALAWLGAQSAALVFLHVVVHGGSWLGVAGFVGFQLFALGAAHLALREAAARAELALTHAELLGTQTLLSAASREAERLRISRELHDSAGHHLTALSLQLEVAKNASGEPARAAVVEARAIAHELLGEVRQVVRDLRDERHVELEPALRALAAGVPKLKVELRVQPGLALDAATAHALFRCAQEAITNALRHAGASALELEVAEHDGRVTLRARDDGRGAARVEAGAGLTGLRERLALLGGSLELDTRPGAGFVLSAQAPARGAPP